MTTMDGGWGWIIVGGSFYHHVAVTGAIYTLSVFYNSWVGEFNTSRGLTSWVLALVMFVSLGSGPIVASICKRFGYRPVVLFGAVLYSVGFFGSCFAQSIYTLIVLIGLVAGQAFCAVANIINPPLTTHPRLSTLSTGFGLGLQYLPCIAVISLYFEKKLSIATGIATAGLGVGAFIFPPFLVWLEDCYTWRGAMLILSGLGLNMLVGGALFRPVDIQGEEWLEEEEESEVGNYSNCDLSKMENSSETGLSQTDFHSKIPSSVDHLPTVAEAPTTTSFLENSRENRSVHAIDVEQEASNNHTVLTNIFPFNESLTSDNQAVSLNEHKATVPSRNPSNIYTGSEIHDKSTQGEVDNSYQQGVGSSEQCSSSIRRFPDNTEILRDKISTTKDHNQLQVPGQKYLSSNTLHSESGYTKPRTSSFLQHPAVARLKNTSKSLGHNLHLLKPGAPGQQFSSVNELQRKFPSRGSSIHTIGISSLHSAQSRLYVSRRRRFHKRGYVDTILCSSGVNLQKAEENHRQYSIRTYHQHGFESGKVRYPSLLRESQQIHNKLGSTNFSVSEAHSSIGTIYTLGNPQKRTLDCVDEESLSSGCFFKVPSDLSQYLNMLFDPHFAIFAIATFLLCFTCLIPVVYMVDRGIVQGLAKQEAALAFSMYGVGNLFGRAALGFAADLFSWDCLSMQAGLVLVNSLSTILSTLCGSNAILHGIYGAVFGTTVGGFMTLNSAVLVEMFGLANVSQSYGLVLIFHASGYLAGTPTTGFILDGTKSYTQAFLINGILCGFAAVLLIILKLVMLRSRKKLAGIDEKKEDCFGLGDLDIDSLQETEDKVDDDINRDIEHTSVSNIASETEPHI